jgi:hypothetical protein
MTLGTDTLTITQDGTVATPDFNRLSYKVIAEDYSKATDRLIAVSALPNELHVYDPAGLSDIAIDLPAKPSAVSVSPDGQYAAVGFDGFIGYISLQAKTISNVYPIDGTASSLVLAPNGYIYATALYGSSILYSIDAATGSISKLGSGFSNSGAGILRLHPSGNFVYQVNSSLFGSPVYDISGGAAVAVNEVPATYPYSLSNFWLSQDGGRILASNGSVYFSSPGTAQDFGADGQLSNPVQGITWIADSKSQAAEAVLSSSTTCCQSGNVLQLYRSNGLTLFAQQTLPSFFEGTSQFQSYGQFVAWNSDDSKLVALVEADPTSGLLSDFASAVISPANISTCTYSASPSTLILSATFASATVAITTSCNWSAQISSDASSWLSVFPGNTSGNGSLSVNATSYTTDAARTGTITVGTATITVTQEPSTCTYNYTVDPANLFFPPLGGSGTIQLATNSDCAWTVSTLASWITIAGASSGTGPATITFTVQPLMGGQLRSDSIVLAGNNIYIQQQPNPNPPNTSGLMFVPLTPCRVADTRNTNGALGGPSLAAQQTRDFPLSAGACPIPVNADAFSVNVTAIPHNKLGYLSVWPAGQSQPYVSILNSYDGRIKANAAIVTAGADGAIRLYATDDADVAIDISGYFISPSKLAQGQGLLFYPAIPCRVLDTRNATGSLGGPSMTAGEAREFPVQQSTCNIPSNAQAYSFNMTAIPKSGKLGYLTVWPSATNQPYVSTLNAFTGTVTANAAIVPGGDAGDISIFVTDDADVVADLNGYFAPAGSGTGGLSLYPLTPCRALDTRDPSGSQPTTGALSPTLNPACAIPATAQAILLNATVVPSKSLGYLSLWPSGLPQPYVSTLNSYDGSVTSNMAIVPASNGAVSAYSSDPTYLLLDVSGYFAP